jgi:hypothetical protein
VSAKARKVTCGSVYMGFFILQSSRIFFSYPTFSFSSLLSLSVSQPFRCVLNESPGLG